MDKTIQKVVIVGGGTAGWMTAAMLKKILGNTIEIELVESETIGIVGVGEATIPPIQIFNQVLGLNEAEFLKATQATIKLAIKFDNWRVNGESYYHTFGAPGKSLAFCPFHHFWLKGKALGIQDDIWQYDFNYWCAKHNKFAKLNAQDPVYDLPYAYHFDATLYGQYLRQFSENLKVKRTEGIIKKVNTNSATGYVETLQLENGELISGDLFVDCSGARGLLTHKTFNTGYEDWSHWLPCDKAVAVPSERFVQTLPYTRSIAHKAGWQWRIPLQHRNGNGLVYSSQYYTDDEAENLLLNNLESKPLAAPKFIQFRTGRTLKQWNRNVVAIGLSSGFLEPLESTSIYLIQSAIVRLLKLFPHQGINDELVGEYNRQSKLEYELIRDFIILHYHQNERTDSQFWLDMQRMDVPRRLKQKMALFKQNGSVFQDQLDIFLDSSWIQVMLGQGIEPNDYHPLVNAYSDEQLIQLLVNMRNAKANPVESISTHDEFLKSMV
ncbi:tryptophan halogenase family protein [Catenovulum adriaticum]|uniref:Tryptophan 7-halogenase n=1 Tax=Catenovulum adriaticum TaxID=2984846 RepID=A0ABY7ALX1_9ALTE|nr:tryptophan halogenase family protein [Catenovulum sp. TS8]WAJ70552.1 tryptophan 7-halogenase [Catenovulum sp. TS8]